LERTLVMVKPDAVRDGHVGEILTAYERNGLSLVAAKVEALTRESAARFYEEHKGKAFFEALLDYMTSGPILVFALAGENAIVRVRELHGATNPADAAEGTIRARFGVDNTRNAVHASATAEDAERELRFHFPDGR